MMILIKAAIFTLLSSIFIALWRLIGKHPESIIKWFPFIEKRINNENILNVFSAETLFGKEAEFINERLQGRNKIIKLFRLLLLTFYIIITIYLILLK